MRRLTTVDVMLLSTVVIWAFNITVTKYVLIHGFKPLAYASVRYGAAALLFAALTFLLEGSLAVGGRRSLLLLGIAVGFLLVNQIAFVYSLKLTSATTVSLVMGTTPIFTAVGAFVVGLERLPARFWFAALISLGGVGLVATGSRGGLSTDLGGVLLAVLLSASWAGYSVTIAPLMRRYSPYRISAIVLLVMWVPLALVGSGQVADQSYGSLGSLVWLGLAYAIVGPLVLTNILYFRSIDRVGPSRATLFTNIQPFMAAIFAYLVLSEHIGTLQAVGGATIAVGILLERAQRPAVAPVE